jgi:membrane-associated phospholipid phosphatase
VYLLWTRGVRGLADRGHGGLRADVAAVAVSRIYLKFHWLTDVLGGLTGGAAYLLTVLVAADQH